MFLPVPATLLHHALEMFLQGCLAVQDTPAQIHRYAKVYRSHKLPVLWARVENAVSERRSGPV